MKGALVGLWAAGLGRLVPLGKLPKRQAHDDEYDSDDEQRESGVRVHLTSWERAGAG